MNHFTGQNKGEHLSLRSHGKRHTHVSEPSQQCFLPLPPAQHCLAVSQLMREWNPWASLFSKQTEGPAAE